MARRRTGAGGEADLEQVKQLEVSAAELALTTAATVRGSRCSSATHLDGSCDHSVCAMPWRASTQGKIISSRAFVTGTFGPVFW